MIMRIYDNKKYRTTKNAYAYIDYMTTRVKHQNIQYTSANLNTQETKILFCFVFQNTSDLKVLLELSNFFQCFIHHF